jgi:hypothetical protein
LSSQIPVIAQNSDSVHPNNTRRNPNHYRIRFDITNNDSIRPNYHVIADPNIAKYFGASADIDPATNPRNTHFSRVASNSYPLVDMTASTDNGIFVNDYPEPPIAQYNSAPDSRRMRNPAREQ